MHAFVNGALGIRTRTRAATSPSIAMYVVSTYCATETSPQIKITANLTVPSVYDSNPIFVKTS